MLDAPRWPIAQSLGVAALTCSVTAALVIASCAAAVRLIGVADQVRDTLSLSFAGVERTPAEAGRIALQNGRIAAAALLCASAVRRLPRRARTIVDVVIAAVWLVNVAAIGLALGAYGQRLVSATVTHGPIELAALSLAVGTYIVARQRPVPARALGCAAAVTAVLLTAAAAAETYVSGGLS